MSYCRFSSDNFRCDVYCYEAVGGGYQVHVAGRRLVTGVTPIDMSSGDRFVETYKRQMADLDVAEWETIGLEYDGQSFALDDAAECLQFLRHLQDTGYHVPDDALEALAEEAEL